MLRLKLDVAASTTSLLCRFDLANNLSIHNSTDTSTKSLALHGQSVILRNNHNMFKRGVNLKHQVIVASLCSSKLRGDHKGSGGSVATIQYPTEDGYIMDPCATQANMELMNNIVPTVSYEVRLRPLATFSSADVVVAPTSEINTTHTRGVIVHGLSQNFNTQLRLSQDSSDSPNFTMQGIQTTTIHQSSSMMANMAFDLLYSIEWQTCIPGGAWFVLLVCASPPTNVNLSMLR